MRLRKIPDATRNAWRFDAPWALGSFAVAVTSRMERAYTLAGIIHYKRYLLRCQLRFRLLLLWREALELASTTLAARSSWLAPRRSEINAGIGLVLDPQFLCGLFK